MSRCCMWLIEPSVLIAAAGLMHGMTLNQLTWPHTGIQLVAMTQLTM